MPSRGASFGRGGVENERGRRSRAGLFTKSEMIEKIAIRMASAEDEEFLFRLFAAARAGDFASLGLDAQQLRPLLEMQYRARHFSYARNFPAAVNMILCLKDGTAVGRHLVERQADCYRTIDIAVLPEYRNRGVATWALRQIQQAAALESTPCRLSVLKTNPALGLYERLGYIRVSADELSYEMEWQPRGDVEGLQPQVLAKGLVAHGVDFDRDDVVTKIIAFLREIGFEVHLGAVPSTSFLPGIQVVRNGLRVDLEALAYPGDLLHEAGHLALMTPQQRSEEFPKSAEPAEEIGALAWSYAAALHIGIAPEIVFHEHGYRGQAASLLQTFRDGKLMGQPLLGWLGLTTPELPESPSIFPKMLRWLRQETSEPDVNARLEAVGIA